MKKIIGLSLAVLSLVVLVFNIEVNVQKEAWALQAITLNTNGNPNQIQFVLVGTTPAYVVLEGLTQIQVINANTSAIISSFNMTNALMNGFNISYQILNMQCNSTLQICVIGYTTAGTGTCAISPNLCKERIVLVDYKNSAWSSLANGANYTYTSQILNNVGFSFGAQQYNIFATWLTNGGGATKIDTWVMNSTDPVNSHKLIFGVTFDTTTTATYTNFQTLGSFTINGQNRNEEAMGVASGTGFQTFDRTNNILGCSVNTGIFPKDIKYQTDPIGTFWYTIQGTNIKKIDGQCNIITTTDITASTGGNTLNSIAIDGTRKEIYVQSNSKVYVINETSMSATPILTFASTTATTFQYNDIASYPNGAIGSLAVGSTTTKLLIEYWNVQGSSNGNSGGGNNNTCNAQSGNGNDCVGQVDCSNPANVNLGMCIVHNNPRFGTGFGGTGQMFNQSISQIACGIGIEQGNFDANGNCTLTNGNIKTNGIGYIIAIIGLGLLIVFFWLAGDHDLRNIPTFVWFIAVLGLLGAMVALNWLDPTFFLVAIIALVALAVAKAKGVLLGDSF